jgi:hypothetical protein
MMLANNTPHVFVTNTPAYLSRVSSTKEKKSYMRLPLVFNVIRHFSSSLMVKKNKHCHFLFSLIFHNMSLNITSQQI